MYLSGSTLTIYGDRGDNQVRTFSSQDALCRWMVAHEFNDIAQRPGAVLHPTAIAPIAGRGIWQVQYPEHSMLSARGNGLIIIRDTSGLFADPEHGGTQITVLEAATGEVLATWLPPHGVATTRFDGIHLIVDDLKDSASICEPLTGRVVGTTEAGVRHKWADPLLPNILHNSNETSRLESPDGVLLWERAGQVRSGGRRHGLSIIGTRNPYVTEVVGDDGTSVWSIPGSPATVTADHVWVDAEELLKVVDIQSGELLSSVPVPWSHFQLYSSENGWDATDNLVLITDETTLAAYPSLVT
jgi:hypothetical protein